MNGSRHPFAFFMIIQYCQSVRALMILLTTTFAPWNIGLTKKEFLLWWCQPCYYLSNKPHFLSVYRRDNPRGMLGDIRLVIYRLFFFSSVLPTSQVGYHAGKPIESVVYCFYKITSDKMENVSVFYEFTGSINNRFLTNQNERTILVIL